MNDLFGSQHGKTPKKRPVPPVTTAAAKPAAKPNGDAADKRGVLARDDSDYSAKDIEVREGLEPVRKRPGMYIGGTDESALHHLAAEILDNSMDEAVAGHASFIEVSLEEKHWPPGRDHGRGTPGAPP